MFKMYAMSDIHGCIDAFEEMLQFVDLSGSNKLVLLGDYLDRAHERPEILTYFMDFQKAHEGHVICLMGNHEEEYFRALKEAGGIAAAGPDGVSYERAPEGCAPLKDAKTFRWLCALRPYYETDRQIFVHAGIDEEAWDYWKLACEGWYLFCKYPWAEGRFAKDVIAGHVGTATIRKSHGLDFDIVGKERWNDLYWDGESHFYLDGSTEYSGVLPLLEFDAEAQEYFTYTKDGRAGMWVRDRVRSED